MQQYVRDPREAGEAGILHEHNGLDLRCQVSAFDRYILIQTLNGEMLGGRSHLASRCFMAISASRLRMLPHSPRSPRTSVAANADLLIPLQTIRIRGKTVAKPLRSVASTR